MIDGGFGGRRRIAKFRRSGRPARGNCCRTRDRSVDPAPTAASGLDGAAPRPPSMVSATRVSTITRARRQASLRQPPSRRRCQRRVGALSGPMAVRTFSTNSRAARFARRRRRLRAAASGRPRRRPPRQAAALKPRRPSLGDLARTEGAIAQIAAARPGAAARRPLRQPTWRAPAADVTIRRRRGSS